MVQKIKDRLDLDGKGVGRRSMRNGCRATRNKRERAYSLKGEALQEKLRRNILCVRTYPAEGIQPQPQRLPAVAEPVAGPVAVPDVSASAYAHAYARECERDTRARCQPFAIGPSGQRPEPAVLPTGRDDEPPRDGQPLHPLAPRRLQSESLNATALRSHNSKITDTILIDARFLHLQLTVGSNYSRENPVCSSNNISLVLCKQCRRRAKVSYLVNTVNWR